ncbi:hypothetical protein HDU81_001341 [Chytriomyces hyalinus]|nr:hypothetical protein HDU81_001341 [Chytriomyces hyalinus]
MGTPDLAISWFQDQLRAQLRENSENTVKYAQCLERQTLVPRQMQAMKDDISELQDQIRLLIKRVCELENSRAANSKPLTAENGSTKNGNSKTFNDKSVEAGTARDDRIPHPPKESRPLKRSSTPESSIPQNTPTSKKRLTAPPSSSSSSASSPRPFVKTPTAENTTKALLRFEKPPPDFLADGSPNNAGYRSWVQALKSFDPAFVANASNRSRVDMFHTAFNLSKVEMKSRNMPPGIPERLHLEFCEFMKSGWQEYAKQEKNQMNRNSLAKAADSDKVVSAGGETASAGNGATPAKERRKSSVLSPETVDSDIEDCVIINSGYAPDQKLIGASEPSQSDNVHASSSNAQSTPMNSLTTKNKSTGAVTPAQSNGANTHSGVSPRTPVQHQLSPDLPPHRSGTTNTAATPKNDDLNKLTPSQNRTACHRLSNEFINGSTSRENSQISKSITPTAHEVRVNSRAAVQEKSQGPSLVTVKESPSDGHSKETADRIPKGMKYVKLVRQVMPDFNELDKNGKSAIHAGVRDYIFEAFGHNETRALKCVPPGFTLETSQMYWIPHHLVPHFQDWLYTQLRIIFPTRNVVKPAAAVAAT